MKLHMREFDGTTFGMEAMGTPAVKRNLKKHIYYADVKPRNSIFTKKRPCISAKHITTVMGEAAWLVSERRLMETVRLDDGEEIYIIYDKEEKQ